MRTYCSQCQRTTMTMVDFGDGRWCANCQLPLNATATILSAVEGRVPAAMARFMVNNDVVIVTSDQSGAGRNVRVRDVKTGRVYCISPSIVRPIGS